MKKVIRIVLLSYIVLMCFTLKAQEKSFRKIFSDTSKTNKPYFFYDEVVNWTAELNFARIDDGVDSFALRVWSFGNWSPSDVMSLHFSKNFWGSTTTYFWDSFPKIGEKGYKHWGSVESFALMVVDSAKTFRARPAFDYSKIIDTINSFNILAIPTQREIPNFIDDTNDGIFYIIEIATKNYYKIIEYHNPDSFKDEPYNKKVKELLLFLSTHLTPRSQFVIWPTDE